MSWCGDGALLTLVIPGRAPWREPGIHQATEIRGQMDSGLALRAPRNDSGAYFSLIGGAIFSAGACGRAGLVAAPWVCGSGRAGSGAGVVGRSPPGFDSAGVLV